MANMSEAWDNILSGKGGSGWVGGTYYSFMPGFSPYGAHDPKTGAPLAGNLLNQPTGTSATSGTSQDIADPFHKERANYQNKLRELVDNPSTFLNSPLFQAQLAQGIQAINRSAAASKLLGSGNRLTALLDYGQSKGSDEYLKQANLLSVLSGATTGSPAAAASATNQAAALEQAKQQYSDLQLANERARKAAEDQDWINQYNRLYSTFSFV